MAINEESRKKIGDLYFEGVRGAKDILDRLSEDENLEGDLPSDRTVYRIINEVK